MKNWMATIGKAVLKDRRGATAIEYAMLAAFIGIGLISLQSSIGSTLIGFFGAVSTTLSTATS
jgi:Flp pilus assembly pilin Flp